MIISFADRDTQKIKQRIRVRKFESIDRAVHRKLRQLDIAESLDDLRVPPGSRLEALQGSSKGFMGIRISDRWRICFRWTPQRPTDVEIIDYH